MRRTIKFVTIAAALAVFAAPVLAQSKECNDENKATWYGTFLSNFRGDPPQQKIAYDAAKLYLTSCPEDPADAQATYMKNKFVIPYEKMTAGADVAKQFEAAVKNAKYAEQIKLGKLVLANDPDNVKVYIIMAVAGLNDQTLLADSAPYAKTAIEMVEAGKPFAPLFDSNKGKALANLNYAIAKATVQGDPTAAIPYFVKALKPESELKKEARIYAELAGAYGSGPVAKLAEDYKKYVGQTESTESKLVLANLNQAIDRQIDALARAAASAATPTDKKSVMDVLSGIYKDRNKSEAGLNELVASVLSKPLPEMPTPITSLPTPTPVSTPATNGSPAGTNGATSSNTAANGQTRSGGSTGPAGGSGAQNGSKTTSGAKPSPSPVANKKPRANHRLG